MLAKLEQEIKRIHRHTAILKFVIHQGPIGIMRLSEVSGFRPHRVRYSLRVLEQKNLIRPSPQGAVPTQKGREFMKTLGKKIESLRDSLLELGHSPNSFVN